MMDTIAKNASCHRALEEAILLVGSVSRLCAIINENNEVKISRSQCNNLKNRGDHFGHGRIIDISIFTGVSPERFNFRAKTRNQCFINPGFPVKIWLPNLLIRDLPYLEDYRSDRLMIVGTNRWLISGLTQANQAIAMSCKSKAMRQGRAITVDLEALLFGMRSLPNMTGYFNFLNSERISIVQCLEQLLYSLQGKWSDLHLDSSLISRYSKLYEDPSERERYLAGLAGFHDLETYHSLKQTCLSGDKPSIEAIDGTPLSIEGPAKGSKKPLFKFLEGASPLCTG